ncbi:MAG: efflux RND transporter periplasmic adaptor subunit [Gemmataceae bacterium]|nr:efflux RND transporter periplasmic adaptor subunit [Gemmataceae bacterium]
MLKQWTKRSVAWVATGLTLTSAVVLLMGLTGCSQQQSTAQTQPDKAAAPSAGKGGPDQPVRVKVVRPVREHLKRLSTPQPAHVGAYEKTDRYARVSGYLETFGQIKGADGQLRPVDIGDRVVKDQVLAKLAVPDLEQERVQKAALVEQAKAELEQAKASEAAAAALVDAARAKLEESQFQIARYQADLAYRKGEYERYAALVKDRAARGELAEEKLNLYRAGEAAYKAALATLATDQANIKVEQAKHTKAGADVATARARLQVAQANLEHTAILLSFATITAPYDGIITRRLVDTGDLIAAGKAQPLFTVARVDRLRIIADVPEAEAALVKVGQRAAFQVNASRSQPLIGRVVRCADALDHETRTMRTEVELDAPTQVLRPGMFGSLTILLADVPEALMLPASALLPGGGKPAVLVVEDGKVRRQEVELGLTEGGRVQVLRGLAGSEQVITDGKTTVRDGQAVEVAS